MNNMFIVLWITRILNYVYVLCDMMETKESYIIMFKPKDKRTDKKADKQEILSKSVKSSIEFLDAGSLEAMPRRPDTTKIGLDINEYEAPILVAVLSKEEASLLKRILMWLVLIKM